MFPEFTIDSITNGVHAPTWVSEPIEQSLYGSITPPGGATIFTCVFIDLPEKDILAAHARNKEALLTEVASSAGLVLNPIRNISP